MITERVLRPIRGIWAIIAAIIGLGSTIAIIGNAAQREDSLSPLGVLATVLLPAAVLGFATLLAIVGLFVVYPNEPKVVTLFGRYVGTVKEPGLWYTNPFTVKKKISTRVRNFETTKLKVNDRHSNPIEIGSVIVWQVVDTAEAMFEVDDYENFVKIQSESALRGLASTHPYDSHGEAISLSGDPGTVATELQVHVQDRLEKAGVKVLETRISHLAYAPEIAQAMLQRQQASAIIAARQRIVEGAVGMVESALAALSDKQIVHLDDERKATMVSNLLVVLCSERSTQPVINTGTLYV